VGLGLYHERFGSHLKKLFGVAVQLFDDIPSCLLFFLSLTHALCFSVPFLLQRSGYSGLGFCVFVSAFAFEFGLFTMTLMDRLYFCDLEQKLFNRMSIHMVCLKKLR